MSVSAAFRRRDWAGRCEVRWRRAVQRLVLCALSSTVMACFSANPAAEQGGGASSGETSWAPTNSSAPATSGGSGTTTGGDTERSAEDSAHDMCPDAVCVAAPPEGWVGPLVESSKRTTGFPRFEFFEGIKIPVAECMCECGAVQNPRCRDINIERWNDANCEDFDFQSRYVAPSDKAVCLSDASTTSIRVEWAKENCAKTGPCPFCSATSRFDIPPAEASTVRYYEDAELSDCTHDGDSCYQAGLDEKICIAREGAHACPSPFDTARTVFEGIADTRACSACECTSPMGTNCTADISIYSGTSCSEATVDSLSLSEPDSTSCLSVPPGGAYSVVSHISSEGSCAPLGGQLTGNVEPTEEHTVCCL
jgi:hypothetical protein